MADEISADLVLRVLNSLTDDNNEGRYKGDELGLIAKILAAKCRTEDRVRILAASLAGNYEMEDAAAPNMAADSNGGTGAMQAYRIAERDVVPVIGADAALACDSAASLYRAGLANLGVDAAVIREVKPSGLPGVFRTMRDLGTRNAPRYNGAGALTMDSLAPVSASAEADFRKAFPTAGYVTRG